MLPCAGTPNSSEALFLSFEQLTHFPDPLQNLPPSLAPLIPARVLNPPPPIPPVPLLNLPPFLVEKLIAPNLDPPTLISLSCTAHRFRKLQPHSAISKQILTLAAKANYFAIFQWAWHNKAPFLISETGPFYPTGANGPPPLISDNPKIQDRFCYPFLYCVAEKQDWKLFKWGYEKGFPCTIFSHFLVVQYGQMELLDLLAKDRSNWSDVIFTIAGARGDLQMLQWAVLNQPKFEQLTLEQWAQKECSLWNQTVFAAVRGGHLEMLQQACAMGCPLPPEAACTIAAKKRDWRTLRWLLDQGVTKTEELRAVLSAYALPDLMTLNAIGIPVDVLISKETFKEGNFSKIQWALSIGFKLTFELYRLGVSSDNPQLIDLLRKQALRQIFFTSFGYKGFS